MTKNWKVIQDKNVRHIWKLSCQCKTRSKNQMPKPNEAFNGLEKHISIAPTFYTNAGTPICQECGEDRIYVRTEILA